MPGMTMPFKVKDSALLRGRTPGDLVTATLVVGEVEAYLSTVDKTGFAPPTDAPPPPAPKTVKAGDPVADAPFTDQEGAPHRLQDWRGHRVALTFAYTRCPLPEFCPLMDRHFVAVQREVARAPALRDVRLLTITIDPSFDTPAVLKRHAAELGADPSTWSFLTPGLGASAPFFGQFGLIVEREGENAGDITHNLRTIVLDAAGRVAALRTGNDWTPAQLLADITATPAPTH
jgi:protein SCO1/2